jgi:hypothetical protein
MLQSNQIAAVARIGLEKLAHIGERGGSRGASHFSEIAEATHIGSKSRRLAHISVVLQLDEIVAVFQIGLESRGAAVERDHSDASINHRSCGLGKKI